MKILIDHQIFEMQKFGGISRYFFELLLQFQNTDNIDVELSLNYSDNIYLKKNTQLRTKITRNEHFCQSFGGKVFKGKRILYKLLKERSTFIPDYEKINRQNTIKKLKKGDFDVFHATYYDDYFLDYIGAKPFVITVHDLIHQIYPEYFLGNKIDKNIEILNRAAAIIAISHSTKKDLMEFYNIPSEKIFVIYHASSLLVTEKITEVFSKNIPEKYILFVGSRSLYKNFYFLAEAFAQIADEFPELHLVCTGSELNLNEEKFLDKLKIRSRVKQYFVDDNALIFLYQNASLFVFPSLYEGFGIPILEAFENECCVLLANSSSLPEIAQDGALYFEPKSISSLVESLRELLNNDILRESLIQKGSQIYTKFSWKKTSTQTLDVYNKAIQNI